MKPLMVVSDLDGTLLDSRGQVSERTREAVRAVRKAGHTFVIATGRPVRDVRPVAEALGYEAIAVCGNGSICYDYARDEVVDYQPIPHADVLAVLAALRRGLPGARLGSERWLELVLEDEFVLDPAWCVGSRRIRLLEEEFSERVEVHGVHGVNGVEGLAGLDERGVGKLIIQSEGSAHDYYKIVADVLPPGCEVTVSTAQFCEVTRAGVDKAAALRRLAGRLGLSDRDTIAFGDMPNDLPMLAWAGRSVAVANAHADVLAAAGEVTGSNDEDGVARYLEQLT